MIGSGHMLVPLDAAFPGPIAIESRVYFLHAVSIIIYFDRKESRTIW